MEESGGRFLVVLLPTQPDYPRVRPLLEDAGVGVVDLNACYESRDAGHRERDRQESPYRLENDGHWNELGNRLAAACLDERLRREAGLSAMPEASREAALAEYYAAFEARPAGAERLVLSPEERSGIRLKYHAFGRVEDVNALFESYLRPDKLKVSNHYDVYVAGQAPIFVKDNCHADGDTAGLFAHATPVDASILPKERSYFSLPPAFPPLQEDGRCIGRFKDPKIPISHILVGQRDNTKAVLWSGEIVLDRAAFEKTIEDLLSAAGEPVIESAMDVHVHGQRLFYVADDCQHTDGRTPFFLHVTPAREVDLPPQRIEHGYDNLDFFHVGVTVGERCVVRWRLPDYPIRHIRTGQYVEVRDGETMRIWEGEAELAADRPKLPLGGSFAFAHAPLIIRLPLPEMMSTGERGGATMRHALESRLRPRRMTPDSSPTQSPINEPPSPREKIRRRKSDLAARICLAAAAVLFAAVLCEVALRVLLPKYRAVAEGHLQPDAMRIFAAAPNTRDWRVHPDTRRRHPFHTNNLGLRQHRDFTDADVLLATTVGVFGDSFVRGAYLDAPHVFTEPLDYLLNLDGDFTVLNFGMAGYEPAQSYFTYRSFHARDDLDYVLFVYFGGNDLTALVRNGLFDLDDAGRLAQREARGSAWWVPFAARLHLTYLVLDASGRLAPYVDGVAEELRYRRDAWNLREPDVPEDILVPEDVLDHGAEVFRQLIRRWSREVEESGGRFLVVLLPTQPDYSLVRPLLDDAGVGVADLNACYESRDAGHRERDWRRSPYRLENDGHWNELGNRLAAACLDERLRREAGLPAISKASREAALAKYYAAFESSRSVERLALSQEELHSIRLKYQAFGRVEDPNAPVESYLRPDKLAVDSNHYDVYADSQDLIFVKDDCHADDDTAGLFAHATPVDTSTLTPEQSHLSLFLLALLQEDGRCIARWNVPRLSISHILVGQRDNAKAVLWSGEIVLDQAAFKKTIEDMLAAAGEPVIESAMDVHVLGRRIFYVANDCQQADGRTPFFLHVTPMHEADLPPERTEHGHANLGFFQVGATVGERCVVRWQLPDYPIRHIHVGQRDSTKAVLWSGEIVLDRAVFEKTIEDMLAAAGEPVIESAMDVHVLGQRLFYVADDCQRMDGRTPFFLHVTPAREVDLPPQRIEHGYDNLDFFQVGATVGERCVVRWRLPDYPIRHIRTGQYVEVPDGEEVRLPRLWEGEAEIGG